MEPLLTQLTGSRDAIKQIHMSLYSSELNLHNLDEYVDLFYYESCFVDFSREYKKNNKTIPKKIAESAMLKGGKS